MGVRLGTPSTRQPILNNLCQTSQHHVVSSPILLCVCGSKSKPLYHATRNPSHVGTNSQETTDRFRLFRTLVRGSQSSSSPTPSLVGKHFLGYFSLLRRSEYLMFGTTSYFYCLKSSNTFFSNSRGPCVHSARALSAWPSLKERIVSNSVSSKST